MKPGRKPKADSPYAPQALELARLVREARDAVPLSQDQVAARAEVSPSWVAKLEQGTITEPGVFRLLTVLRVIGLDVATVDRLLDRR